MSSPSAPTTLSDAPELDVAPELGVASPAAIRELVLAHLDFVWRSLRRFGVPAADVDDATQQVFLIAGQKLAKIQAGSERAFLMAIALRIAAHSRRARRRRDAATQRFSETPHDTAPDPEELTQRLEARALLDRVLDTFTPELRNVFVLVALEEYSVAQVAELLRIPRGTAATRLRRAWALFQEQAERLRIEGGQRGGEP